MVCYIKFIINILQGTEMGSRPLSIIILHGDVEKISVSNLFLFSGPDFIIPNLFTKSGAGIDWRDSF